MKIKKEYSVVPGVPCPQQQQQLPPMVSIIVPLFNVGTYASACFESILEQTFTDFEVLIIDDASTDEGPAIAESYFRRDARFILFHQNHGGLSAARNHGLSLAAGKFVIFIDSDDTVLPELLAVYVESQTASGSELVVVDMLKEDVPYLGLSPELLTYSEAEIQNYGYSYLIESRVGDSVCNKLYIRAILEKHNIRFYDNAAIFAEDLLFNLCYFPFVRTVHIQAEPLYRYTTRTGSYMESGNMYSGKITQFLLLFLLFDQYCCSHFSPPVQTELRGFGLHFLFKLIHQTSVRMLFNSWSVKLLLNEYRVSWKALCTGGEKLEITEFTTGIRCAESVPGKQSEVLAESPVCSGLSLFNHRTVWDLHPSPPRGWYTLRFRLFKRAFTRGKFSLFLVSEWCFFCIKRYISAKTLPSAHNDSDEHKERK